MDYSEIISLIFSSFSMIFSIFTHIRYSKCCNCMEIEMKDSENFKNHETHGRDEDIKIESCYEEEINFQEIKISEDI